MTPGDIITEVRALIPDTRSPQRYSDTFLLGFVNQTLKRMVMVRPDLFALIGDIATTPNTVLQSLPADSMRLIEIFQVKDGSAVTEANRDMLDQMAPTWVSDPAGTPVNFMRHVRNANRFFLYPRPVADIVLVGEYAQTPPDYTISETIDLLPDAYFSSVVDGTVFLAESVDDEHVNSGRAQLFQESFFTSLGASLQSRSVTDTEKAAMNANEVI